MEQESAGLVFLPDAVAADYANFFKAYVVSSEDWATKDFGKPNIERFGAASHEWLPSVVDLQMKEDGRAITY